MNEHQFFDWQTLGGATDVEKLVGVLERSGAAWCMIGGLAVNHWAEEALATADVDIVIGAQDVERCVSSLEQAGFRTERFAWSVNLKGRSKLTVQISTDPMYSAFPETAIEADVHGITMRVATLENTLRGKLAAYGDPTRRGSKRQKDLLDIVRLIESHPALMEQLPETLLTQVKEILDPRTPHPRGETSP